MPSALADAQDCIASLDGQSCSFAEVVRLCCQFCEATRDFAQDGGDEHADRFADEVANEYGSKKPQPHPRSAGRWRRRHSNLAEGESPPGKGAGSAQNRASLISWLMLLMLLLLLLLLFTHPLFTHGCCCCCLPILYLPMAGRQILGAAPSTWGSFPGGVRLCQGERADRTRPEEGLAFCPNVTPTPGGVEPAVRWYTWDACP